MRLTKKTYLIIILILAIILVSGITVMHLIGNLFSQNGENASKFPTRALFETPSSIEITAQGKKVTLTESDAAFEELLKLNRERENPHECFFAAEGVVSISPDAQEIVMTYCYGETARFDFPVRVSDPELTGQNVASADVLGRNISFILSGDYHNAFVVNEQSDMFYTVLNPSAPLIEKAKELLKATQEKGTSRTPIFEAPSEILLQVNENAVTLSPNDQEYQKLVAANELRATASFYKQIEGADFDYITLNNENHKMVFRYDDPSVEMKIPLAEGEAVLHPQEVIFPPTAGDPDLFIVKTEEGYQYFTGLTFSMDMMQTALKVLSSNS